MNAAQCVLPTSLLSDTSNFDGNESNISISESPTRTWMKNAISGNDSFAIVFIYTLYNYYFAVDNYLLDVTSFINHSIDVSSNQEMKVQKNNGMCLTYDE